MCKNIHIVDIMIKFYIDIIYLGYNSSANSFDWIAEGKRF